MHLPTGLMAEFSAEPLQCCRRRDDDPALPASLHDQLSQIGEPVVLDRLRHKGRCQFSGGSPSERTKLETLLALDGMALAIPLAREIIVDRFRKHADLFSTECKQGRGWSFTGSQGAARMAQVAEHDRIAEPIGITVNALARKLLIALWRMVTTGEVPHGVVLRQPA